MADVQVNLVDKHARERQSHEIALAAATRLQAIGARLRRQRQGGRGAAGPPVLAA
ncbi:MAG: hypothetical protein U5K73_00590 [Halofilum sp. (in: g-proteobacteria)]|nr:hypothetical protein [Halofilum sp. (in: g-proteobacteria)]